MQEEVAKIILYFETQNLIFMSRELNEVRRICRIHGRKVKASAMKEIGI